MTTEQMVANVPKKDSSIYKTPKIQSDNKIVFYNKKGQRIINEDFLTMEAVKNNIVDLVITSPPYNLDISYNSHNDKIEYSEYLDFSENWIKKCHELAKDTGRFCLNVPLDKNKNGQQSVCSDLTAIAKKVGWKYHSTIIWNEGNISRRTAWGSWLSASAPYVIAPVEVIIVLYKEQWKKKEKGKSDIGSEEFKNWTNGLWTFNGESKKKIGHPAPFPRELPRRCIKLFSYVGDVVLDPFLGSGTTLIETLLNNRIGIGVEKDEQYANLAVRRIEEFSNDLFNI
jgi:site-specific DNA-methyltransferase (adenine-specific)